MQRSSRTRIEYREQSMGKLTCTPLIDYYYGHEYNYTYDCTHRYWLKSSVSLVTIMVVISVGIELDSLGLGSFVTGSWQQGRRGREGVVDREGYRVGRLQMN